MKRKFTLLLLVLFSLVLSGCSSTIKLKDIVDPEFIALATKEKEYAKPFAIPTTAELDRNLYSNTIIGFKDNTFYNIETKEFITFDRIPTGEINYRVRDQYIVISSDQFHYVHSGKTGKHLLTISRDDYSLFLNTSIRHEYVDEEGNNKSVRYVFKKYEYKTENIEAANDDAPNYDEVYKNYGYVAIDNNKIKVFKDDQTYHMISFIDGYEIGYRLNDWPSSDRVKGWYVLNNGNILIQRFRQVPNDFADYHFTDDGVRFVMKSELFNLKSASLKEIDLDFVVDDVANNGFHKAENLVKLSKIDPILKDWNDEEYVFYDNEMKKPQRLEFKYGNIAIDRIAIFGKNLFLYYDETSIYALDGSNNVKGEKHYDSDRFDFDPLYNGLIEFEDDNTNECILYDILKNKTLHSELTKLDDGNHFALYRKNDGKVIIVSLAGIVETEYTNYRMYGTSCFKLYNDDENTFELFNIEGKSLGKHENTTIEVIGNNLRFAGEGYLAIRVVKGLDIEVLVYKVK